MIKLPCVGLSTQQSFTLNTLADCESELTVAQWEMKLLLPKLSAALVYVTNRNASCLASHTSVMGVALGPVAMGGNCNACGLSNQNMVRGQFRLTLVPEALTTLDP